LDLRSFRFLIIDDHLFARRTVIAELQKYGAEQTDEAANGVEGLEKIKQACDAGKPYDIVFLDWAMPEMNGADVLVACRADSRLDAMAIVMVSAESEDENILKALEAGATAYVPKPFQAEMIIHKLEDVLHWKTTRQGQGSHA